MEYVFAFTHGTDPAIGMEVRERIVRCRDCEYAVMSSTKSIIGTEVITLTCSGPIQGAYSEVSEVAPEGFCAWGERNEES